MNIFLTIPQGQCIRDFLILGIVDRLLALLPDCQVVILTPAYKVRAFLNMCPPGRVHVRRMETPTNTGRNARLTAIRRRQHSRAAIRLLLALETRRFQPPGYLLGTFHEFQPGLVVSTHPMPTHDYDVIMTARKLGTQTLGVVKSWDNIGKGLTSRPHLLSVWNAVNRDEAISLQGYAASEITINGVPSFDPYFDARWIKPHEDFLHSLGLDPSRPVITYATSGVYDMQYYGRDETFLADDLLRMFSETIELRDAQLIIRLHPGSQLQHFWRFRERENVVFSFASYMPTIGWYTSREDILHQANLLQHSDVIVTPGSSWAVEAAVFDTPTVVPVYSDIQPAHAKAQFDDYTLAKHFRPLAENNWVPICRSYEQTRAEIVAALTNCEKYRAGRTAIVDNYVYYRDNNSYRRVAEWIAQMARTVNVSGRLGI